jgi:2',3'-cyclic-nucleotide 2'-phosphodiesterase
MRIAFIGDIVGRPGRAMVSQHLSSLKKEFGIDFVIANYENASHGFGLTKKNAVELFNAGIDTMTGGNHSFDKADIVELFSSHELLRPHNYPEGVAGTGLKVYEIGSEKLAVLNLLGHYGMPHIDNVMRCAEESVNALHKEGIRNIFIDFHAEATSEKRALMALLAGRISAICGTHTHVSSDDLHIVKGTGYLTDIGLTGCRDNVIGMDKEAPLQTFLTGVKTRFEISNRCKKIMQMLVCDIHDGKCTEAFKIKLLDDTRRFITQAWIEED